MYASHSRGNTDMRLLRYAALGEREKIAEVEMDCYPQ